VKVRPASTGSDRRGRQSAALGLGVLAALGLGTAGQAFWPPTATLDCAPAAVRWVGSGAAAHARCGAGERPPPAILGALGLPMPLNDTGEEDLARLPGIGRDVARALVAARPFRSWSEVDAVRGVGPARLATLRARTALDP
jgi:competence protein ComEA